jgi:lipopolysaccharide export system ATP-binding protein
VTNMEITAERRISPSEQTDGVLTVRGLRKSYGGRPAVRGVDLYVKRGETVGLLGPNGAGKTTCFYMITGLIKSDAGEVEMNGVNLSEYPIYERARIGLGYLPQENSVFKGLTVEENLQAALEAFRFPQEKIRKKIKDLCEEFSIGHLSGALAATLSGGERRRLEIARALAIDPDFLLLDEPFAGVDPVAAEDIRKTVEYLTKERNTGVLITDHNVRETLEIIQRGYIIYDGVVLMQGDTQDIINNPEVRKLYLGENFGK